ncbi:two-component sensor histidine kinase [Lysinibacillus sp. KCTC 33748]|uniref:sensor histidine kinase n=1 Tax=unclassified Lysinibacillus TaxID=2636778 RepID=UPI0009A8B616|nr:MULTISPECIES: HAMP domain-containing sensor histidine kinase [unclassified Lysinibacillus]OXS72167.1 two-component sensor histidine kinase [Lysinibacillus sp. KCTC 33748]SKB97855.1 Signal transduction histidine kinase [Lysinibacillus sp. AC-3]
MNKISTKLAASFFVVVLIMELFLMFYLHRNIIKSKVEEELVSLLANGENHRDVLLENYSDMTIKHIVLMEKNKDREVMITDKNGRIIGRSTLNNTIIEEYMPLVKNLSKKKDQILVADWRNSPYIVSAHPYNINNNQSGYVVMFQSTSAIKEMVHNLNKHFFISGITSIVVLLAIYALLSKVLTRPLIRMKAATEKLSHGDFNVSLADIGKDELGELAKSIQKLADDLERLQKERNEFLASIAHELSTPLTYLIGYSKVAMRENLNENDRNHYLEIITEESNRMKELVKNLLELAKMDQNTFSVSKEYFSAHLFLDHICKRVAPSFDMNNIKLILVCEEDFDIYADSIRLEQIMLNLLDNAMKYSDKNTRVIIEAMKQEERTVINVIDEGIGIPSDELELIFEKLYRVEKSRSRTFGGSGIGLAVVKELVEAHGGTIKVKSNLGKGSTFTITI